LWLKPQLRIKYNGAGSQGVNVQFLTQTTIVKSPPFTDLGVKGQLTSFPDLRTAKSGEPVAFRTDSGESNYGAHTRTTDGAMPSRSTRAPLRLAILIPIYDDWISLRQLLSDVRNYLEGADLTYEILIVDDGSPTPSPDFLEQLQRPDNCVKTTVLRLHRNVGHQRAIAIGLAELQQCNSSDCVLVMDGDGEDSAAHIKPLVETCVARGLCSIVFARRTKRMERWPFRLGYELYCFLHYVSVGSVPRVGNFSVIPSNLLPALVIDPNLWNHYAAAVFASRLAHSTVSVPRAKRYEGQTKLSFSSLVVHGISALACYSDRIGVRAIIASSILIMFTFVALLIVSAIRLFTPLAIPGWATTATGFLVVLSMQILTLAFAFCLLILSRRQDLGFIPSKDAGMYVLERRVFERA
jgi:hypothetical protein